MVSLGEENVQSLLEQVRELQRLSDKATCERARFDGYVQARLRWDDRNAPALPAAQHLPRLLPQVSSLTTFLGLPA